MVMACIIIAHSDDKERESIRKMLAENGFSLIETCSCASHALVLTDRYEEGIVICPYRLPDLFFSELAQRLRPEFKLLLLAGRHELTDRHELISRFDPDIMTLPLPLQKADLLATAELMLGSFAPAKKRKARVEKKRDPVRDALINEAKALLMSRNSMTEREAHRYIQKTSMDKSQSFEETAKTILEMR